ncbi:MAG: hypothetical protein K0S23_1996 [Fluviicola sp.]|jgi:hypothetical protein|uniref:DUF4197 domain-containing protein n=1 Tax=Fluviicola sp. TaxID=1917219 RepID=UPI002631EF8A|nr:DUF4197 domain-containing protein [Fluviicola sp.]MDF3027689.1 hypothetical protein [Fluviicola sp.]
MKISIAIALVISTSYLTTAQTFGKVLSKGKELTTTTPKTSLTNDEVVSGLREALTTGAKTAAGNAGVTDGFYKNQKIFIPWPAEAKAMKDKLVMLGMQGQVTAFEESVNRAAEEASKSAFDVFATAVKGMSVGDGFAILNGSDTAATHYLREKTTASLTEKFTPIVKTAMEKVRVTEYWNPLVTRYNKIPGVTKQNPDLEAYVTAKAINGLMLLISEQEAKIRKDPAAQVTDLLKKVFGKG